MKIATPNDWPDLKPMSQDPVIVELDEHFDGRQMNRLRQGFVPLGPAQKWFLYFEDDTLHCHRSWTGCKMFEVVFVPEGAGAVARTARVNLDPGFYSGTFDQARKTLFELLRHHAGDGDEDHKPGDEDRERDEVPQPGPARPLCLNENAPPVKRKAPGSTAAHRPGGIRTAAHGASQAAPGGACTPAH